MQTISYMGTMDDVVLRYPSGNFTLENQKSFKKNISKTIFDQLINSAIYDQKVAINDGYIVANELLLPSLKDLSRSLLGNMFISQSAVLFSRSEPKNIAMGIEESAKQIETHKQIVNRDGWPAVRGSLEILQKSLLGTSIKWPEDKNMGAIFYKSMESLFLDGKMDLSVNEKYKNDFEAIFKRFQSSLDGNKSRAREIWEDSCWIHFLGKKVNPFDEKLNALDNYNDVRAMMNIANEAYHISYSCGLKRSVDLLDEPMPTRPLTSYCPAYDDLFSLESRQIDSYNLQMLGKYLGAVDLCSFFIH